MRSADSKGGTAKSSNLERLFEPNWAERAFFSKPDPAVAAVKAEITTRKLNVAEVLVTVQSGLQISSTMDDAQNLDAIVRRCIENLVRFDQGHPSDAVQPWIDSTLHGKFG